MKKITWFVAILLVTSLIFTFVGCKDPEPILDTTPPAEVTELTIKTSNGNALLSWQNPVDEDFDGVKISMNPPEGTLKNAVILEKEVTSFEVSGLENGKEYTFIIKTFDTSLNYSKETIKSVSVIDTSDKTAPAEVTELAATNKDSSVLLTWKDATDNDILGYEVSWDKSAPINRSSVMESNSMMVAPKAQGCYISNLTNGTTYSFTVKSVDTSGNRSKGQTISITPAIIEKSSLVIELIPSIIEKTKENVEISVKVTTDSASVIKKIAYKEGTVINTEEVLAGTDITVTPKIIADKNTTYTVVATDTAGRREIKWITVDNIDFDPPAQVSDFNAVYNKESKTISVSWKNPLDEDFAGTILTYKKRNSNDITTFEFEKNIDSTQIEDIPNDGTKYILSIKTKDVLDNKSSAKTTNVTADNILSLTINAGKGWLETETGEKVKSVTAEFESGESFYQIYERFEWEPYEERDEEKDIYYCYKENGNYYGWGDYGWGEEVTDEEGNILLEVEWESVPLYEDTTWNLYYRKLVPITYNFNGGKSKDIDSDYGIEYQPEGIELSELPDFSPYREGYFLRGWTKTIDGEDYVTVCPSEPTTLYAKWEEPKTCTLTLKPGEYSSLCGYSSLSFNFQSGKNLGDVLSENGYTFANIVEESEIVGKRFGGFKDSQGNEYNEYTMLSESVELEAITRDLYYYEVGINMNLNGINIEGYDEYCVYVETYEYKEYLEMMSKNLQDEVEDYFFVGWTFTKDDDDFVDSLKGGTTTTIYAKWMSYEDMAKILPYYYNEDKTQVTFIFRPADFGLNWKSSDNYTVKLMCEITNWDANNNNEDFVLSKNSDGNYAVTFDYNDIADGFFYWAGFQFCVKETTNWYGWPEYKYSLPEDTTMKEENGDRGFKLQLFPMSLGIDLNGGNIYGDTTSKFFDISWTQYDEGHFKFISIEATLQYDLGVQNPTKDGYVFAGWTFTKDGNDFVDYKYEHLPYGNYTLYAKWNEDSNCTLTLCSPESEFMDRDGNSLGDTLELSFVAGQTLSNVFSENNLSFDNCLNSFERDENYFTFNGTFTSNTDGDVVFEENSVLRESITLYPVFETGLASLFLELNGGYVYDYDGEKYEGNLLQLFQELTGIKPQKDNYYFGGWTITPDGEDFINETDEAYYVSLGSPYLYAKWLSVTEVLGQATWYYLDIPTDVQNVIFNAGENQTIDIMGIDVSSGSIYYAWDSTKNRFESNTSVIYEPDNKPEGQPGRVWCYTNSTSVPNCFWWGCSVSDDARWPGKPMTKEGEEPVVLQKVTISKIEVTGLPAELADAELYLAGTLQPSSDSWTKPGTNADLLATITDNGDGTCTLTFDVNAEFDEGPYQFKFAAAWWSKPEICGFDELNNVVNAEVTLKAGDTVVKGVFDNEDGDRCYRCTWSVE